ncbi:hypothetical protein BJ912DRAFT_925745 [Pholiota molesta]|nr:hypothetical protein BJ912DRAFT_925745 [Pholiota molesta]
MADSKKQAKGKKKAIPVSSEEEYSDMFVSDTSEEGLDGLIRSESEGLGVERTSPQAEDLLEAAEDRFLRTTPSALDPKGGRKRGARAYVVFCGKRTGIFLTWSATQDQTRGFKGSVQQGYNSLEAAESAWKHALATGVAYPSGVHGKAADDKPNSKARLPPPPSAARSPALQNRVGPAQHLYPDKGKLQEEMQALKMADDPKKQAAVARMARPSGTKATKKVIPKTIARIEEAPQSPHAFPSISNPGPSGSILSRTFSPDPDSSYVPWFVVIRGDRPGVYQDRLSALAALGRNSDLALEKVATQPIANELFTAAYMEGSVLAHFD